MFISKWYIPWFKLPNGSEGVSHSIMSDSWNVACQAPLFIEFSRQEYRSGLPFPFPRDLPNPGIEPASPALAGGFFTTEPPGKPLDKNTAYVFEGDFQSTFLNL